MTIQMHRERMKMTVHTHADVFCDNCGNWEHGGGTKNAMKARSYVQKIYKWKRRLIDNRMVDLCPYCETVEPSDPIPADAFDNMQSIDILDLMARNKKLPNIGS